jgi:predicted membrane chloride channel (bestrophin family)
MRRTSGTVLGKIDEWRAMMTTELVFGAFVLMGLAMATYVYVSSLAALSRQLTEQRLSYESLLNSALLHVASRDAKQFVEVKATEEYEKEALRQQVEAFELSKKEVQKDDVPKSVFKDIHGNEYEVIGGEL